MRWVCSRLFQDEEGRFVRKFNKTFKANEKTNTNPNPAITHETLAGTGHPVPNFYGCFAGLRRHRPGGTE
ncbi:hypothetical protein GCM10028803_55680 [Larkinella knui]